MPSTIRKVLCGFVLPAAVLLAAAGAAAAAETASFARVAAGEDGRPRALQVAIASYVPADRDRRARVDLVAAVHVGDADYYAELNNRFRAYDAVLYELVAPPGAVITRDAEKTGFVSGMQKLMTRALDLSFQLDEVDYTPPNFVHADLSGEELAESMAERDESLYTWFWRIVFSAFRDYAKDPLGIEDWRSINAAVGGGELSFKTLLAFEIASSQSLEEVFGDDADSSVIGVRNARAIETLEAELEQGARFAAIFYGVGHMPDLEERLLSKGFLRDGVEWIDAWQLADPAAD